MAPMAYQEQGQRFGYGRWRHVPFNIVGEPCVFMRAVGFRADLVPSNAETKPMPLVQKYKLHLILRFKIYDYSSAIWTWVYQNS